MTDPPYMIDPHVHCRDGKQSYKETIEHVFKIADGQGIKKIFDMPNTDPPILYEKDVLARLKLVPENRKQDYYMYIGATEYEDQLKEAAACVAKYREVVGIKMFAGQSTGNLALVSIAQQQKVYRLLSAYTGVLAVHCEREDQMHPEKWIPSKPSSWNLARPKSAEIESVKDQIRLAKEAWFKGNLHICHVSCAETIMLIKEARSFLKITCGVTPHHVMWNDQQDLLHKVNPPLRKEEDRLELLQAIRDGLVDWIESDHAPHAIGEKLLPPYMSGFPSLYYHRQFIEFLVRHRVKRSLINMMTYDNIKRINNKI